MSLGNLYLQKSGESGWIGTFNTGVGGGVSGDTTLNLNVPPVHPNHLGLGVTGSDVIDKFTIGDTGVPQILA